MVGSVPPVASPVVPQAAAPTLPLPLPRRPLHPAGVAASQPLPAAGPAAAEARPPAPADRVRGWYENELGWTTVPGEPVGLSVGVRFDVLEVPAEAGHAALRRLAPGSPVAVRGDRMRLLVAAGSAEELPGILRWLEWGELPLDLTATGAGGVIEAPLPPGLEPSWPAQGAAVWVRPPETGCEVEASLPTVSALGGGGGAPDLVRWVDTLATHCHRVRLRRVSAQALAFS
ncbi:SCO3374 family protein [Streptomyces sp. NPDC051315]|uniref:SCO3374 family protein n=1 Tax=Streptomyces sp. NPDC051315 TaxID=3365650 RepID=UPI0037A81E42